MAVPEHLLEKIRESIDIVDVVNEYVSLKKAGSNYKAICPFHKEKTPSFIVSPAKQIFHCFGCGEGGNVFNFLMKAENLAFPEALKRLAHRAGISLPQRREEYKELSEQQKKRESLFALNEEAVRYFIRTLKSRAGEEARNYLRKRGITEELQERFQLGYASSRRDSLYQAALRKGYSKEILRTAGLVSYSERTGDFIDYFITRLIFPIFNPQGKVIGFGGRALSDRQQPKYLNSPETSIFKKGASLYGLVQAKSALRESEQLILLEGYMDVLALHQYGFNNAVATLGTALTEEQVILISRYVPELIMVYDADPAGVQASIRGIEITLQSNLRVKVATLPRGQDPDDYLRQEGREKFVHVLNRALPVIEYRTKHAISTVKNIRDIEGKMEVIKQVLPLIARQSSLVVQKEEIKKLAATLLVDEEALLSEMKRLKKGESLAFEQARVLYDLSSGYRKAQYHLIGLMIQNPELVPDIRNKVGPDDFTDRTLSHLVEVIYEWSSSGKEIVPIHLMDYLRNERISKLISEWVLSQHHLYSDELIENLIKSLKRHRIKEDYQKIKKEIDEKESKGEDIPIEKLRECQKLATLLKGKN